MALAERSCLVAGRKSQFGRTNKTREKIYYTVQVVHRIRELGDIPVEGGKLNLREAGSTEPLQFAILICKFCRHV